MTDQTTALSWEDVLKRDDLVGGDLEVQDREVKIRGPIVAIESRAPKVAVGMSWSALRHGDGSWECWSLSPGFTINTRDWLPVVNRADYIEFRPDPTTIGEQPELYDLYICRIYPRGTQNLKPAEVVGLPQLEDQAKWQFLRVELLTEEWAALCVPPTRYQELASKQFSEAGLTEAEEQEYDQLKNDLFPALPKCCANVSALRETIEAIYDNDGYVWPSDRHDLIRHYWWVVGSHDHDWSTLNKVVDQVQPGWSAWVKAVMEFNGQLSKSSYDRYSAAERQAAFEAAHKLMHSHILELSRDMTGPRRSVVMSFWAVIEKMRDTLPTKEQCNVFGQGIELLVAPEVTSRDDAVFFEHLEAAGLYAGIEFDDTAPFHEALRELRGGGLDDDLDEDAKTPEE